MKSDSFESSQVAEGSFKAGGSTTINDAGKSMESAPDSRIGRSSLDPDSVKGNIENYIGSVEIPVGLARPLLFNGEFATGEIAAPIATTEGALVASISRGAKLLSLSGGVRTQVLNKRMLRVPVFRMKGIPEAMRLADFLRESLPRLQALAGQTTRHGRLITIEPVIEGRLVHAQFIYDTEDAAGQNMTTVCTDITCQSVLAELKKMNLEVEFFAIDGGLSGDKKVNHLSFLEGRGTRVTAEAHINNELLKDIMKVDADALLNYTYIGCSALYLNGSIGANINFANLIAGIFTATGQDIACVHESSLGLFKVERAPGGIYVSVLLPALIVGTVGGGTGLPAQQEALAMMGCAGAGKSRRLAEIIAGYCMALDLSTMSALVHGSFAAAHDRLGRNRPGK